MSSPVSPPSHSVRSTATPFVPEVIHGTDPTTELNYCFDPANGSFSVYNQSTHGWEPQDPLEGPLFVFDQQEGWIPKQVLLERQQQQQQQLQRHFTQMQAQIGAGAGSAASATYGHNGFAEEVAKTRTIFSQIRTLANQVRQDGEVIFRMKNATIERMNRFQAALGSQRAVITKISKSFTGQVEAMHIHINERQRDLEAKIARLEELTAGIDAIEESIGSLKANVETKEAALVALNARIESLEERIEALNEGIKELKKENRKKSKQITKMQKEILRLKENLVLTEAQATAAAERAVFAETEARKSSSLKIEVGLLREELERLQEEAKNRVKEINVAIQGNLSKMIQQAARQYMDRYNISPKSPEERAGSEGEVAAGAGSV